MAKESAKQGSEMKRYEPSRALSPFEEMERMFESFMPRGWLRPFRSEHPAWSELARPFEGRVPNVDVIDRDDEVIVRAEVPGIKKEDLEVSVTDNAVTIKAESKHEEKEEKGNYYRCEISSGAFTRTVALPDTVSSSDATAKFENGVLELKLPKIEKTKRRIVKID